MANSISSVRRVAIIGGGYAGLGCSATLTKMGNYVVHLYDSLPAGCADASATSAGIMHPMATRGKIIWKGEEGMSAGLELLNLAQQHTKHKVYDTNAKLHRFIFSLSDLESWKKSAVDLPDYVEMEDVKKYSSLRNENNHVGCLNLLGVALIKQGVIVNSPEYLRSLWSATLAASPQSKWIGQRVQRSDIKDLSRQYDAVIVACGAGIPRLCGEDWPKNNKLSSLRLVRGQNLFFSDENAGHQNDDSSSSSSSRDAYLSGEYMIPCSGVNRTGVRSMVSNSNSIDKNSSCTRPYLLCGPSHEHVSVSEYEERYAGEASSMGSDVFTAQNQNELLERVQRRYPSLVAKIPFSANAGTRLVTQRGELGRLPIVSRLPLHPTEYQYLNSGDCGLGDRDNNSDYGSSVYGSSAYGSSVSGRAWRGNVWLHGGFGSRGLILHGITAKYLCEAINRDDDSNIPSCLSASVITRKSKL